MKQLSTYVYSDALFDKVEISNAIFTSPYKEYPYLIIKNFFTKDECRMLTSLVKNSHSKEQAEVRQKDNTGFIDSQIVEHYRKTNIATLNNYYEKLYSERFSSYKEEIEAYYAVALKDATKVQVLEYTEGFFYMKHSDDSSELVNKEKETIGFKVVAPKRKLSSVLFITSHTRYADTDEEMFSGGELKFNYLYTKEGKQVSIEPEAGDMIVFPSHPYFSHEVLAVKKGYRLTLVQWHDIF